MTIRSLAPLALALLAAVALVSPASAETFNVANNGLDSATCGSVATPCRSISQALVRAASVARPGRRAHRILVGPGRYGDLDGDGQLGGPGEEFSGAGSTCDCVIDITMPIVIESTHGAAVTVIHGAQGVSRVVRIASHDVVFGGKRKGFMIRPHRDQGLSTGIDVSSAGNAPRVTVSGHLLVRHGAGLDISGSQSVGQLALGHSVAIANDIGFSLPHLLVDSDIVGTVAIANSIGMSLNATDTRLQGSIATANGDTGFRLLGPGDAALPPVLVNESFAVGNGWGISALQVATADVSRCILIGNGGAGLVVMGAATATITSSNIFGNSDALLSPMNCGVDEFGGAVPTAAHNFWGDPGGFGPDPADDACLDDPPAQALPFATAPFHITPLNLW